MQSLAMFALRRGLNYVLGEDSDSSDTPPDSGSVPGIDRQRSAPEARQGKYEYQSLPSKSSMRLISFDQDVLSESGYSCCLSVFDLQTAPRFHALSYTWGSPFQYPQLERLPDSGVPGCDYKADYYKPYVFQVDGKALVIKPGRNLHEALKQLCDGFDCLVMEAKYLWVDAICINQGDDDEKTAQMLIMGDIYRNATKVICWLGVKLEASNHAIEALETLQHISQHHWTKFQGVSMTDKEKCGDLGVTAITEMQRKSLSGFLTRAWFSRVWIVQEAVFAERLEFVCGNYVIASKTLFNVSTALILTGWSNEMMSQEIPEIISQQVVPPGGIASIELMRKQLKGPTKPSPLDILASTRSRQATEPHDSVYGLLSVLAAAMGEQPENLLVQPDASHKVPLEKVMEMTTLMVIRHENNLQVLHQVQEPWERSISGCASWTVNWRQRMIPHPLIVASQRDTSWSLAGQVSPQLRLDTSMEGKLKFNAAKITSIAHVSDSLGRLGGDVSAWLRFILDLNHNSPEASKMSDKGLSEILWRTAIADVAMDTTPAAPQFGYAFALLCMQAHCQRVADFWAIRQGAADAFFCEDVRKLNKRDPDSVFPDADQVPDFLWALRGYSTNASKPFVQNYLESHDVFSYMEVLARRLEVTMMNRCLAKTVDGQLAAVPMSSRCSDSLWAIPGLETPFVLRESSLGEFEFVGEAYIHGAMHGENSESLVYQDIILF